MIYGRGPRTIERYVFYTALARYAEFDTEISEEEAMEILKSYKPVELQTMPLTQFEEP